MWRDRALFSCIELRTARANPGSLSQRSSAGRLHEVWAGPTATRMLIGVLKYLRGMLDHGFEKPLGESTHWLGASQAWVHWEFDPTGYSPFWRVYLESNGSSLSWNSICEDCVSGWNRCLLYRYYHPAIEGKAKVILRHLFGRITGTSDSGSFSRYDLELEVAMAETIMWISFLWKSWSNPIRLRLS
jgi:hypothetical protein